MPIFNLKSVILDTASIDSNHAQRDKHLRDEDFIDVGSYPQARFVSTSFLALGDGKGLLKGILTLRGISNPITSMLSMWVSAVIPGGVTGEDLRVRPQRVLADFCITKYLGHLPRRWSYH